MQIFQHARQTTTIFLVVLLAVAASAVTLMRLSVPVKALPAQQTSPEISFNQATQSVGEADGTVKIRVNIDPANGRTSDATVRYRTLNGSAFPGSDYTRESNANNTLTFFMTDTLGYVEFTIPILNDTTDEPNENFFIILESPTNATLGALVSTEVVIVDNDDPAPGSTPQIFADRFEPNDDFGQASDSPVNGSDICSLTLWPIGDVDYFRFVGKAGSHYEIETKNLSAGLDTVVKVYSTNLNVIGSNDDFAPPSRASKVGFTASNDGFFYIEITNRDPTDPSNKTYCLDVNELRPEATSTPPPGLPTAADECEFNSTIQTACLLVEGEVKTLNFLPTLGSPQDTDILRIYVKPGIFYTCETEIPDDSPADTNIILWDSNGNPFVPNIGNDDKNGGVADENGVIDLGSRVTYLATYTGWLYVVVGPRLVPPYEEAAQYTYTLSCLATASTPTPTPFPTAVPGTGGGGGTGVLPTATPIEVATALPTPTPIDFSFLTPMPPPVAIQPLPTPTAVSGAGQSVTINVTLFYDANDNFTPELTEGIMDAAVALYDNATGKLISFGTTNEAGIAQFSNVSASGAIRVTVPFLNYSQIVVGGNADILIRVAPQPLPIGIP